MSTARSSPFQFNQGRGAFKALDRSSHRDGRRRRANLRSMMLAENRIDFDRRVNEFATGQELKENRRSTVSAAFGAALRHYRKLVGYSQEELAAIAGFDRTYPSLLERGLRAPTIGTQVAMACALKITPIELHCTFLDILRKRRSARKSTAAPPP